MNNNEHALQEAMRIAQSESGKQLLNLLQKSNADALNQAIHSASNGNFAQAQSILKELLTNPEAQKLLQNLGDNHG